MSDNEELIVQTKQFMTFKHALDVTVKILV